MKRLAHVLCALALVFANAAPAWAFADKSFGLSKGWPVGSGQYAAPYVDAVVFVIAGQSNFDNGSGTAPHYSTTPDPNILIWRNGAFAPYQPGVNASNQATGQWGAEVEIVYQYRQDHPTTTIYLVKQATGGTTLAVDWKPDGTGAQWNALQSQYTAAKSTLQGLGVNLTPTFLWMQGEADSGNSGYYAAYQTNLTNFVAAARTLMGSSMQFIIGRISAQLPSGYNYAPVQAAQLAVSQNVPNTPIISTDTIPIEAPPSPHFTNPAGIQQLGLYFYQKFNGTYAATPSPSITWASGFTNGTIPADTSVGTVIATLSATNPSVGTIFSYSKVTDPSGVLTVNSTNLQLAAAVTNGTNYSASFGATNTLSVLGTYGFTFIGTPPTGVGGCGGAGCGGGSSARILDNLTSASATRAYSTSKLRGAYVGPSMNVRRASDNTTADIGFNNDATASLNTTALLNFCASTSCYIVTWYDQSTNAKHMTQSTASLQPRIVNAGALDTAVGTSGTAVPASNWVPNDVMAETGGAFTATEFVVIMSLPGTQFTSNAGFAGGTTKIGMLGANGTVNWSSSSNMLKWSKNNDALVATGTPATAIFGSQLYSQRAAINATGLSFTNGFQFGQGQQSAFYATCKMTEVIAFAGGALSTADATALYNDEKSRFGL